MPLAAGQSLSFYEVLGPLGAGGMGEVYLARDTRLDREVAIKVLPEELADDEERLRRFEREAKTLASLNHPNVAGIHGIDQVGDTAFLAMELVPGEDLEERLRRGALPVSEALAVCRQIAEGLEAAHEAGIVHRDLKPANIRITPEGVVKLLDFGLAKPIGPTATKSGAQHASSTAQSDSFLVTEEGMILGTPTYMSPEQARGKPVDKRTDIWAFGCVLLECLTGRRAYEGDAFGDLIVAILEREPDLAALPKATPLHVRELIVRCVIKDPRERLRDIGEARIALDRAHAVQETNPEAHRGGLPAAAGWIVAGIMAVVALLSFFGRGVTESEPTEPVSIRTITYSGDDVFPSASPDGRFLAFRSGRDGRHRIWIKQLETGGEQALTDGLDTAPKFSPDGESVLFLRSEGDRLSAYQQPLVGGDARKLVEDVVEAGWSSDGSQLAVLRVDGEVADTEMTLNVVDMATGVERELYRTVDGLFSLGWSPRGDELSVTLSPFFGTSADTSALLLLPAQGGAPRRLPIEGPTIAGHAWVGDGSGRSIVYHQGLSSTGSIDHGIARVVLWDLDRDLRRTLFYTQDLYMALGGNAGYGSCITVVRDGVLALDATDVRQQLWEQDVVDGRAVGPGRLLAAGDARNRQPVYSPDGGRLRFSSNRSGGLDLWELELADGRLRQLTVDAGQDWDPAFGSDGEALLWSTERSGAFEVWTANSDGSNARQVSRDGVDAENPEIAPGGAWIVYWSGNPEHPGVWRMRPDGQDAERIVAGGYFQTSVSPDGRWAAYILNEPQDLKDRVLVVEIETKRVVPFEITIESGRKLGQTVILGRTRWVGAGPLCEGLGLAFIGLDEEGRTGVFLQDFDPERDTSSTRRPLAGFHDELITESFDVAPDGSRVTLSMLEIRHKLMLAEGVQGVLAPRTDG